MKYTDRFFKFPVRMYDVESMIKVAMKEEETGDIDNTPVNFAVGNKAILLKDLKSYGESYANEHTLEDALEHGFPLTTIYTYQGDEYQCPLNLKEFEKLVDKFVEEQEKQALIALNIVPKN